jgi:hypothetical protein
VKNARKMAGSFVGNTPGDAGDHTTSPPQHLVTKVPVIHPQHNRPYCFSYSLASVLFYCKERFGSEIIASQAELFSSLHMDFAIKELKRLMPAIAPTIGRPFIYNKRTASGVLRHLTWTQVLSELTPYPTLIIPVLPNGTMPHALCVVDDLIFDSITSCALKLCKESLDWIFNDEETRIYIALRFQRKCSPKSNKVKGKYIRPITLH